jgi:Bax protein
MKRKDFYLFAVFYAIYSIFLPEPVPGKLAERADEVIFSKVVYSRATTFPEKFSRIQDPQQRKQELIELLLPLVLKANEDILAERHELQRIKKASRTITSRDKRLIEDLAQTYHVETGSHREMLDELLVRVDVLPVSLVLAQAAIESGWGTSRFALKGNNLFGLRCPSGLGILPSERGSRCGFSISTFEDLQECVKCYMWNINTRMEYKRLRKLRTQPHVHYDPLLLAHGLDTYSEMGPAYVDKVKGVIRGNNLKEYDSYRLRPQKDERTAWIFWRSSRPAGMS